LPNQFSNVLRANAALAGLTDEQLTAITTLSVNDENSVIAKKTGEIYGGLDADILAVSGIAKNGTEKTFDYAKRVLTEFKTKVEGANGLQSQIDSLTKEKARLEKAIADGATDAETAKALKQAKADLQSVTTQYNDLKTKYDQAEQTHTNEVFGIRVETALQTATAGLKFKAGLPESATKVLLDQAIAKIKGMNPEFIDDGKGGKMLAFKDENDAIMRNPNNQLNPYTLGDVINQSNPIQRFARRIVGVLYHGFGFPFLCIVPNRVLKAPIVRDDCRHIIQRYKRVRPLKI
jgi:hypothetical protein